MIVAKKARPQTTRE